MVDFKDRGRARQFLSALPSGAAVFELAVGDAVSVGVVVVAAGGFAGGALPVGSAATHQISGEGKRDFNPEFLSLVAHYGLTSRTIHVGDPNGNGDVEAHHGHLKRRLEQHLLLRGYRDFASEAAYDEFLAKVLTKANCQRNRRAAAYG